MKPEEIMDAMEMIDNDLIETADRMRQHQTKKKPSRRQYPWVKWIAAAACICLVLISILGRSAPVTLTAYAIAEPEYPEMAAYPTEDEPGMERQLSEWSEGRRERLEKIEGYEGCLDDFLGMTMRQFLSGSDGENYVYSPMNMYMALGMLAEVTDGQSRQQILDVLDAADIRSLRKQITAIWNASYCKDGTVTSVLANSLWLNQKINYKKTTMETLASDYYASSFSGEMGTEDFDARLQQWVNEQTGDWLKEQTVDLHMQTETVLALVSAIDYQARWSNEFYRTETGTFHGPKGDANCDFMYQSSERVYYWDDRFSAVVQELKNSGGMWLILPEEGVTVDELLSDTEIMDLMTDADAWENSRSLLVHMAMPKFDISSNIDLTDGFRSMGITDVFDSSVSDFSPLTSDTEGIYVSTAIHGARVAVDEEGCRAAAYTILEAAAGEAEEPADEVDFILDRPFLFVMTNECGLPLFAGVVNQPVSE